MNKLDAVNLVLRKAGLYTVSSLDTNGASDAAEAERCIDEKELQIQLAGWHYNMRENVTLEPDEATSKIYLPPGCLTIDSDDFDAWRNITQLGDHLVDRDNNTDTFDGELRCSYTLRYTWDCIPIEVRNYIAHEAAVAFLESRPLTREKAYRVSRLDVERDKARTLALQINGDREDVNTLNTSSARSMRGGRTVLSPINTGFFTP